MDDIKLAMLGDKEASKRLTEKGVLVPCPFCGDMGRMTTIFEYWIECDNCGARGQRSKSPRIAQFEWNTRAPILSESEFEKLEG